MEGKKTVEMEDIAQGTCGRNPADYGTMSFPKGNKEAGLTVGERQRPATKDFIEVLVELEPIRENSEHKEENSQPVEHQGGHDTGGVPDLSGLCRHNAVQRKTIRTY